MEQPNSTYQTGSTQPPKSRHGLIAFLLILITVLCSVITVLGMMNIQLSKLLKLQNVQPLSYEPQEQIAQVENLPRAASMDVELPVLGMTCVEIDNLYRNYHQLPQGLYVTQLEPGSCADLAGLQAGDVLISCDDSPIGKKDTFFQYVEQLDTGSTIRLLVFRDNQQLTIELTI